MVTKINRVIGWLFLLALVPEVHSATQIETHSAYIAVTEQSTRTQSVAMKKALEVVLIKMTGRPDIGKYAQVQPMLNQASNYLNSYHFDEENGQLWYVAEFDTTKLESFLRDNRLPIWGRSRPDSLVWLAVEQGNGDRYILTDASDLLAQTLIEHADKRGIPTILPVLDLTDTQSISMYDIWGLFSDRIKNASVRYGADITLGGRLFKTDTKHQVDFSAETSAEIVDSEKLLQETLESELDNQIDIDLTEKLDDSTSYLGLTFTEDEFSQMQSRTHKGRYGLEWVTLNQNSITSNILYGDDKEELIKQFVDSHADSMGQQYAILPFVSEDGLATKVKVSVSNLNTLSKYVEVLNYFSNLPISESVTLSQQQGSVATFNIELLSSSADFLNTLSLEPRLSPILDAFGQPVDEFNFYWNE